MKPVGNFPAVILPKTKCIFHVPCNIPKFISHSVSHDSNYFARSNIHLQKLNNEKHTKMKATLQTNHGDIVIDFFDKATPETVANFVKLAKEGFYNGIKFHRVIKDFMIQGGDPLTKDDSMMHRWGTGGPGYKFADEITAGNSNAIGTISMANAGPNTNGSQFFINLRDNHFLNSKHTVFGQVVAGIEVARAIEAVPTAPGDRPIEHVVINNVVIED